MRVRLLFQRTEAESIYQWLRIDHPLVEFSQAVARKDIKHESAMSPTAMRSFDLVWKFCHTLGLDEAVRAGCETIEISKIAQKSRRHGRFSAWRQAQPSTPDLGPKFATLIKKLPHFADARIVRNQGGVYFAKLINRWLDRQVKL